MPRYTPSQQQAFAAIEARFKRPLSAIAVEDLNPNPKLEGLITLYGGLRSKRRLTRDQHKRLLYQAWQISSLRR